MSAALANKAYQLSLDPVGSRVFGYGIAEILSISEEQLSKKRQHSMEEAVTKSMQNSSNKGVNFKSSGSKKKVNKSKTSFSQPKRSGGKSGSQP